MGLAGLARSRREEFGGEFVGFAAGDAEAKRGPHEARLETVLVVEGDDFGGDVFPVFSVSEIADENAVAIEAAGVEAQEEWRQKAGVKVKALPKCAVLEFGERAFEMFAEK